MSDQWNRRRFVAAAGSVGMAATLSRIGIASQSDKPALLGGTPVRRKGLRAWPIVKAAHEQKVAEVVRSGRWYRSRLVPEFERTFAEMNDAKYCVACASGTTALYCSLGALGVGPGDEVILGPYTFMATLTVVLQHYAMPVFVDTDRETFLMDPAKLEAAITERTAAIIPIHIGGSVADMDRILAVANKHGIPVVGDACQAHLAQWRNRSAGSWGTVGCYSFQLSKNICAGEGGAMVTNDEEMANKCFAFHNCARKRDGASAGFQYELGRNTNARMTEFQAAVLLAQMDGVMQRAATRTANAEYLSSMLREIPGVIPAKMYDGCTRNAYHLYMFRYQPEHFAGLPRNKFVRALRAEGIPVSTGYGPLNKADFLLDALRSKPYVRVYGKQAIESWPERNACPENDKLCEEGLWFIHYLLLESRSDMEQVAEAVRKIQKHAAQLARV